LKEVAGNTSNEPTAIFTSMPGMFAKTFILPAKLWDMVAVQLLRLMMML
jgi:hypothetical protein